MERKGTITVIEKGKATIHSYTASEEGGLVTTQIIETEKGLVVIDAQFLRPHAREVRDYIFRLGKPVERVIVSHSHPDHWFGLEYLSDHPVYALAETGQEIMDLGEAMIRDKRALLGELVTDSRIIPDHTIEEGQEVICGLRYDFKRIREAEAGVQLLIHLPEVDTLIAQDLLYNGVHLFIGHGAFEGWIEAVKGLEERGCGTILVGHGRPAGPAIYKEVTGYIEEAGRCYRSSRNGEELKERLMERYPDHLAPFLLDISNGFLYPGEG